MAPAGRCLGLHESWISTERFSNRSDEGYPDDEAVEPLEKNTYRRFAHGRRKGPAPVEAVPLDPDAKLPFRESIPMAVSAT